MRVASLSSQPAGSWESPQADLGTAEEGRSTPPAHPDRGSRLAQGSRPAGSGGSRAAQGSWQVGPGSQVWRKDGPHLENKVTVFPSEKFTGKFNP